MNNLSFRYDSGIVPSINEHTMPSSVKEGTRRSEEFAPSTIKSIGNQQRLTIETLKNIYPDWNIAKLTIETYDCCCSLIIALMGITVRASRECGV